MRQLGLLPPDRVRVELRRGAPVYTVADAGSGRLSEHGVDDIIHVRALGSDGLVGLSPVRQCAVALGLSRNLTHHASAFFRNSARPAGFVTVPASVDEDDLRHISTDWRTGVRRLENAHRTPIIRGDIAFVPISMPMEDAQFLEQRELSATEVARILRVP